MKNNKWRCDDYDGSVLPKNIPLGEIYYMAPWVVSKERESGTLRLPDSSPSFCCSPYPHGSHEMGIRRVEGKSHQYELFPEMEHIKRWPTVADGSMDKMPIAVIAGTDHDAIRRRLERLEKKIDILIASSRK